MTARQCIGILCLVVYLPGCVKTLQPYQGPGVPPITGDERVAVDLLDGETLEFSEPFLTADGFGGRVARDHLPDIEIRTVPLDSISGFQTMQEDNRATALGLVGVAGVVWLGYKAFKWMVEMKAGAAVRGAKWTGY